MRACCVVTAAGRCPGLQQLRASSCRASRSSKQAAPVNAQSRPGAAVSSPGSSGSGTASFGACVPASSSSLGRPSLHAAWLCTATGGGDGGSTGAGGGGVGGSGSGSGGSGGNKGEGEEDGEEEFLDLQQAEEMAASKGIELPEDFRAAAGPEGGGLRRSALEGYFKLAGGGWLTSLLVRSLPAFRNRLLADRLFFFKVAAEVMIDSGCATVAELRKRGDDFWGEFEFYLSDLMVGLVLDVVLVTLLAPPALIGRSRAASATGLKKLLGRLPSAVFQKSLPGRRFTILERGGTFVKLGLEYSLAGIVCGFIGQGIANSLMRLKRHYGTTSEHDVAVPPLMRTALVWGLFMGVSSNSRYQVVFGLERIVDQTIARRIPQVAYFTTLAIRFANNVVGGENFIDMARWAGVQ